MDAPRVSVSELVDAPELPLEPHPAVATSAPTAIAASATLVLDVMTLTSPRHSGFNTLYTVIWTTWQGSGYWIRSGWVACSDQLFGSRIAHRGDQLGASVEDAPLYHVVQPGRVCRPQRLHCGGPGLLHAGA